MHAPCSQSRQRFTNEERVLCMSNSISRKVKLGSLAVAGALVVCSASAWAYVNFGYQGRSGNSGRDGQSGRNGQDATILADGTWMRLELSGTDAYYGEDGVPGEDASNCIQPRPEADVYGA